MTLRGVKVGPPFGHLIWGPGDRAARVERAWRLFLYLTNQKGSDYDMREHFGQFLIALMGKDLVAVEWAQYPERTVTINRVWVLNDGQG